MDGRIFWMDGWRLFHKKLSLVFFGIRDRIGMGNKDERNACSSFFFGVRAMHVMSFHVTGVILFGCVVGEALYSVVMLCYIWGFFDLGMETEREMEMEMDIHTLFVSVCLFLFGRDSMGWTGFRGDCVR